MNKINNLKLIILSFVLGFLILSIKSNFGSVLSSFYAERPITIIFVGDIMLGRSVNSNIAQKADATWPFHYVFERLSSANLTIGNLETPLINNCPQKRDGMIFCGEASNTLGLKYAGIDYVSLANNHSGNYGQSGLATTNQVLQTYGVNSFSNEKIGYGQIDNTSLAFLGFDDVSSKLDLSYLSSQIKLASATSDLVFVFFHWGQEYKTRSDLRQQLLAHVAIDAGASAVIGAHPHVVQESELYHGKPIYYSLGNFVFDQEWSNETKKGLAIQLTYNGAQLIKTDELPLLIKDYGQPHWQ